MAEYPQIKLFVDKERDCLSAGWDRIVRVDVYPGDQPPQLWWAPNKLEKHDLSKEACSRACREPTEPAAEEHWCR